jgi:hypothetical protein
VILLNAVLFLIGCALLWQVLKQHLSPAYALPILAFVALGHLSGKIVATGMEASLAFAIAMCFLWVYLVKDGSSYLLGLLLGALVWARLDIGVLYLAGFLAAQVLGEKDFKRPLGSIIASVGIAVALVCPILAFNYLQFGELGTISSATKVWATRQHYVLPGAQVDWSAFFEQVQRATLRYSFFLGGNTVGDVVSLPYSMLYGKAAKASEFGAILRNLWLSRFAWIGILSGLVLVASFLAYILPRSTQRVETVPRVLWIFLLGVPFAHLAVVLALISLHGGSWYWLWMAPAFGLVAMVGLGRWRPTRFVAQAGLLTLALMGWAQGPVQLTAIGAFKPDYSELSWYSGPLEVAQVIEAKVEQADSRIGCFNAGLLGYLSPVTVVNLDGLVNNWELLRARQEGRFRDYLIQHRITHLVDFGAWNKYLPEMGLSEDEVDILFLSETTNGYLLKLNLPFEEADQ